ncbi:uncharacterized protein BO80DRAFT_79706 [Aspergillus ibericus CBS 121593]|uniref:Uncharacterized protein n=1 Tax=Aspergillus ibericus CBS 121593 TaxID=1448316 RepID=A0A395HDJ0_9EURO|nr:hypothetical protein BO80DRAFT_79706 [Aspergillus ibericus CBS 121593]RAL05736.1 hypothetical protein BO80DRAFT_79706 [Aspergillus ibericus CBS 121593]
MRVMMRRMRRRGKKKKKKKKKSYQQQHTSTLPHSSRSWRRKGCFVLLLLILLLLMMRTLMMTLTRVVGVTPVQAVPGFRISRGDVFRCLLLLLFILFFRPLRLRLLLTLRLNQLPFRLIPQEHRHLHPTPPIILQFHALTSHNLNRSHLDHHLR